MVWYCSSTTQAVASTFGSSWISLQSSEGFYFHKYKRRHCPANQVSSFSCTKLPTSYAALDLLLNLTQQQSKCFMGEAPPSLAFSSQQAGRFSSFMRVIKWTQTLSRCETTQKISQLLPLGTFLVLCCSNVPCCVTAATYELFHRLLASVHSRGVSIYIAVWWWQWPDGPKRLPPLLKAISLQWRQNPG